MSFYANYIKEREGFEMVETDRGFATYRILGEEVYIRDIYVHSDFRQTGEASRIADMIAEIAKLQGCKHMAGTVCPSAKGSTESLKVLLGYGFKLFKSQDDFIIFKKELV